MALSAQIGFIMPWTLQIMSFKAGGKCIVTQTKNTLINPVSVELFNPVSVEIISFKTR